MATASDFSRPLIAVAIVGCAVALLSGCAVVEDVAYGRNTSEYADIAALTKARGDAVLWVPADSTALERVVSTRDEEAESILVESGTALPDECTTVPRRSAPTMAVDGAPDAYEVDEVSVCDGWAVIASDAGWYGWRPAIEAGD